MSTWNDSSFTTDLMILVFLASILIAYNIRFIRIFCQPVYLVSSIPNIDQYILYLRPFETDNTSFEGFIKYISDKSYKAIAIANPHMVVQNVESDKIYATDEEWKDAVHQCMQKSKFNILHIGNTDGCLWELQRKERPFSLCQQKRDIMYYRISSINLTNMYISPNCHKTVLYLSFIEQQIPCLLGTISLYTTGKVRKNLSINLYQKDKIY